MGHKTPEQLQPIRASQIIPQVKRPKGDTRFGPHARVWQQNKISVDLNKTFDISHSACSLTTKEIPGSAVQ